MRILITGAGGMLGTAIQHAFSEYELYPFTHTQLDVTDSTTLQTVFEQVKPTVVIHCAAYTNVDGCEENRLLAYRVNTFANASVARACAKSNCLLISYSSDYVFDGTKTTPYQEEDKPHPLSEYGRSKWLGEIAIQEVLEQAYILRSSWLYGPHGKNFVDTILNQARSGNSLKVVNDQIGAPTFTPHLAAATKELSEKRPPYGVYHVTNSGSCSWFDFAQLILKESNFSKTPLTPISSEALNRPAKRPKNSQLSNAKWMACNLSPLPHHKEALQTYLNHN